MIQSFLINKELILGLSVEDDSMFVSDKIWCFAQHYIECMKAAFQFHLLIQKEQFLISEIVFHYDHLCSILQRLGEKNEWTTTLVTHKVKMRLTDKTNYSADRSSA